jgi:uncharacterized membrane protein YecN with MAPEG domain
MLDMTATHAAGLWSGLLILLFVVLSIRVVLHRRRHKVLFGEGGVHEMTLASRGFGNAAEYIPVGIGALILLALGGWATWTIHAVGAAFFLGRLVHPWGLVSGKGPGLGRMVGMALTWTALITAAGLLIACPLLGLG